MVLSKGSPYLSSHQQPGGSAVPTPAGQAGGHTGLGPAERARRSGRPGWRSAGWPLPALGWATAGVGWVLLQSQGRQATGNTGPTSSTLSAHGGASLAGPSTSAPKSSRRPPHLRATGPGGTRRGTWEDSGLTQRAGKGDQKELSPCTEMAVLQLPLTVETPGGAPWAPPSSELWSKRWAGSGAR